MSILTAIRGPPVKPFTECEDFDDSWKNRHSALDLVVVAWGTRERVFDVALQAGRPRTAYQEDGTNMKARVATILSLTGVLVAGSAAALVNTQVLNSASPASSTKSAQIEEVSTSSASSVPTSDSSVTSVTVPNSSETTQVSATGTQAAYQIGDAGIVTLDTAGDTLRIVAVTPSAGWMVIQTEQKDALNIEVKFQTGDTIVEFKANLMFGIISTAVESYSASGTSTANSTGNSIDDDDDSPSNTTGNSTSNSVDDDSDDSGSGSGKGSGGGDDSDDD